AGVRSAVGLAAGHRDLDRGLADGEGAAAVGDLVVARAGAAQAEAAAARAIDGVRPACSQRRTDRGAPVYARATDRAAQRDPRGQAGGVAEAGAIGRAACGAGDWDVDGGVAEVEGAAGV